MAQKVQVILVDDVDGGPADETVTFSLDGVSYEIDLAAHRASQLRDALEPWIEAGRRTATRRSSSSRGSSDAAQIRAWAKGTGLTCAPRTRPRTSHPARLRRTG
jgi:hypothetical protein